MTLLIFQTLLAAGSLFIRRMLVVKRKLHLTARILNEAVAFEWLSVLLRTAYYAEYAKSGRAPKALDTMSRLFHGVADVEMVLLLIFLGKGWTVVRRKLSVHGRVKLAVFGTTSAIAEREHATPKFGLSLAALERGRRPRSHAIDARMRASPSFQRDRRERERACRHRRYGVASFAALVWSRMNYNPAKIAFAYDGYPGALVGALRAAAALWFLYAIRGTRRTFSSKKRFFFRLQWTGAVWLAATPVCILIAHVCEDPFRRKTFEVSDAAVFALGQAVLTALYNPVLGAARDSRVRSLGRRRRRRGRRPRLEKNPDSAAAAGSSDTRAERRKENRSPQATRFNKGFPFHGHDAAGLGMKRSRDKERHGDALRGRASSPPPGKKVPGPVPPHLPASVSGKLILDDELERTHLKRVRRINKALVDRVATLQNHSVELHDALAMVEVPEKFADAPAPRRPRRSDRRAQRPAERRDEPRGYSEPRTLLDAALDDALPEYSSARKRGLYGGGRRSPRSHNV